MRNRLKTIIMTALVAVSCVTEQDLLENRLFYTSDNLRSEIRVAVDEGIYEAVRTVSASVASPLKEDLTVDFIKSPELLETYRQAYYSPDAELLPDECCDIAGLSSKIVKGSVESLPAEIHFSGLDALDLSWSKEYVLPVTLRSDGVDVLESARTMYFVIRKAYLVNMAGNMSSNRAWPVWDNFDKVKNLEAFTLEALVYNNGFDNGMVVDGAETWNADGINTIMGVEDHFLVRIGDSSIPSNQLQVACAYKDEAGNTTYRKAVTSSACQLKKDRWYHIAVTFDRGLVCIYIDGKLKASENVRAIGYGTDSDGKQYPVEFTSVNFGAPHSEEDDGKPRCFWVGYSYQPARYLDGMLAEVRLWDKALSVGEINASGHFYKLYASDIDDSLLAYWKFDDGAGKTVKDHSSYGYDLTAQRDIAWYPVELK